ncbi:MAG: hypothetical protein QOF73_1397 [Thermomicrobiales bacterium]|nr:hypothetical protein [Thermomicrobiales bacterium]
MNAIGKSIGRIGVLPLLVAMLFVAIPPGNAVAVVARQDATPTATYSCDTMRHGGTPTLDGHTMSGMDMGTPMGHAAVEFDQLYIDMMIPHHESIIALVQAALPRLTDERLRTIAQNIMTSQSAEIPELMGYREQFYGSAEPMPMDHAMMTQMHRMMPGMSASMDQMAMEMDTEAQVAAFCAADNPDLAFIDLTIPHHRSAVVASEAALTHAIHQEIKEFAQKVIDAQQKEIDELTKIRQELAGAATPTA